MKLSIKAGSTSQTVNIFIQDSSSTTGAGLTGLVFNTASLTAYYALSKAAAVSITLATLAAITTAWSSGGFKEVDATNMPGWYRFDIPDAALASGRFVSIHFKGATNMAPLPLEIELTGWDNQDAVRGGMTAMPNANAEAAGGLYTRGTGAGQLSQTANGELGVATLAKTLTTYTGNTPQTGDGYAIVNSGTFGNSALKTLIDTIDDFVDTEVAAIKAKTDNLPSDPADASDIAASFATVASTLSTIAGYIDTEVAAILAAVDTEVAAIKAKTDNLPAAPAAVGDIPTAVQNADALIARNIEGGSSAGRTVKQALASLRNKVVIAGGVITVYDVNDSGVIWTGAVATTAGDPLSSIDPA